MINTSLFEKGLSYQDYREMIQNLLEEGKTTGTNHTDQMIFYTRMNVQRMKRLDKTSIISQELQTKIGTIRTPQVWLLISEAWCGDAAQNIPFIAKLAKLNKLIELKIILRDEYPEIMELYLTNGSSSIPKLIAFDIPSCKEIFRWGPRPQTLHQKVLKYKDDPQNLSQKEFIESIHLWYALGKNRSLDAELSLLIRES